ncbi:hypothetical protein ACWGR4_00660 [Embleya sp. NPDC055664]
MRRDITSTRRPVFLASAAAAAWSSACLAGADFAPAGVSLSTFVVGVVDAAPAGMAVIKPADNAAVITQIAALFGRKYGVDGGFIKGFTALPGERRNGRFENGAEGADAAPPWRENDWSVRCKAPHMA